MKPQLFAIESGPTASVMGFDLDAVQEFACNLVCRGFVPVEDDYCLMEHKTTGQRANFRKITLIRK